MVLLVRVIINFNHTSFLIMVVLKWVQDPGVFQKTYDPHFEEFVGSSTKLKFHPYDFCLLWPTLIFYYKSSVGSKLMWPTITRFI